MPDGTMAGSAIQELEIVRTNDGLAEISEKLRSYERFALDTEFVGERTYLPTLSLVQIATVDWIVLIDPISISNLDPFWELVADPDIEKVLHAAREDLRLACVNSGLAPRSIFDTQVAAGFVGLPQYPISYAKLVEAITGVRLSKSETRSEWDKRPLTPEQIRYAKDDVRYLLEIRNKLGNVIEKLGRTDWFVEEMGRFSDPGYYITDPEDVYLKLRGPRSGMGARQTAVLRAVAAWREREASEMNVPARTILRDETLTEIALRPPTHLSEYKRLRNFPAGDEVTIGPHILAEIQAVRRLTEDELPAPLASLGETETPAQKAFSDLAFALATIHAQANRLSPELVLSRAAASDLTLGKDASLLLNGWRKDLVGYTLQQLLEGKVDVRIKVEGGVPKLEFNEP